MKSPGNCGLWPLGRLWVLRFLEPTQGLRHHYLAAVVTHNQVSHLLKGIMVEHSSKLLVSE